MGLKIVPRTPAMRKSTVARRDDIYREESYLNTRPVKEGCGVCRRK